MDAWSYELAPELPAIRPAAACFRSWAVRRIGEAAAADCELALVEACNNLIMHNTDRELISLRAEASDSEVTLIVRDSTAGFEWPITPTLPQPNVEHGRGIFLMHALMTNVEYKRHNGWNELRLCRRL